MRAFASSPAMASTDGAVVGGGEPYASSVVVVIGPMVVAVVAAVSAAAAAGVPAFPAADEHAEPTNPMAAAATMPAVHRRERLHPCMRSSLATICCSRDEGTNAPGSCHRDAL